MKARIVSTAIVCTLASVCGLAQAQDAGGTNQRLQRLMERFHTADVDGDGHLTRDEAQKGMPRVYEHFSEIDTDNKGYVTLDQITAYLEAHPGRRARNAPPSAQ